ncbi:hypothetical protein NN3_19530 [Nocardia neocaledoniensis NBRC 108232]|uniref:hypothetical protein n=1 Tax=Nocardia neocaledoniensis TaxID=236511 RepID=UPI00118EE9D7|nr:hypothetical protein [Nocardia neocaledoniensis]GEM30946.1 hypothetical protein NN3_19530 [Nocardia neocaledoniensis NBRC 108232]
MSSAVRKMSMRRAAAVVSLFAGGCGTGGEQAGDAGPPRSGGTLRFSVASDAGCVDPQQVGSSAAATT